MSELIECSGKEGVDVWDDKFKHEKCFYHSENENGCPACLALDMYFDAESDLEEKRDEVSKLQEKVDKLESIINDNLCIGNSCIDVSEESEVNAKLKIISVADKMLWDDMVEAFKKRFG